MCLSFVVRQLHSRRDLYCIVEFGDVIALQALDPASGALLERIPLCTIDASLGATTGDFRNRPKSSLPTAGRSVRQDAAPSRRLI